ncbi:ATP-grasp domain-containing protein [Nocardioides aurantiacus]|uniref:ATP-grasp domain-containing protein n=1 Tax=Nocardioides aurantiacus TaxID=86796 RepID=UPI00403F28B8
MGEVSFLVSSAGRRGELVRILREVAEAAGGGSVYAVDRSRYTAAGWLADGLDLVPSVSDAGFVDALLEVCERRGVTHLVPTIDPELPVLAAARGRFAEIGTTVWVSSPEAVAIAQDKRQTHRWLREAGLPCVEQRDLDDVDEAWLHTPRLAKPAGGSSAVGQVVVRGVADLAGLDPTLDYVVEELARGEEHTVDVLVDREGRCRCAVPRLRLETRAGEVSKGRTVRHDALEALAVEVAEALPGAYGVLNVQVFLDAAGAMNVIEINARFGGGFPLSWAAGAQLPLWLVQEGAGMVPTARLDWLPDQVMLRYDAAVHLDWRS